MSILDILVARVLFSSDILETVSVRSNDKVDNRLGRLEGDSILRSILGGLESSVEELRSGMPLRDEDEGDKGDVGMYDSAVDSGCEGLRLERWNGMSRWERK